MEKTSKRTLLSIIWRGVCKAGKKVGKVMSDYVGDVIIYGLAVIMLIIASFLVYVVGLWGYGQYKRHFAPCDPKECYESTYIYGDIYFHQHDGKRGYVFNMKTGKKLIKGVDWISEPEGKDSLVCFSNGKKRGYFSKKTGNVVIEPKYDHAWVFSEGLAQVDEGGHLRFIDQTGKIVIDNMRLYDKEAEYYAFHGGYCLLRSDDGEKYGLMDKTGKYVLPMEYDDVTRDDCEDLWKVRKGAEEGVFDKDMKPIVPLMECDIEINYYHIDVTMPDHTIRKYDFTGTLLGDFYYRGVRMLTYDKEELVHREFARDDDEEYYDDDDNWYRPKATARLRAYWAADGYEGLMTADGHIVTMPLYQDIDAIGYDLYLCEISDNDNVIVNGKGEIVK